MVTVVLLLLRRSVTITVSSFRQIERGVHYLNLLNKKSISGALVYKFNKKSTTSVRKGESTIKVPFNFLGVRAHVG